MALQIGGRYELICNGKEHILLGTGRIEKDGQHVVIYRKWTGVPPLEHWVCPVEDFEKNFALKEVDLDFSERLLMQSKAPTS